MSKKERVQKTNAMRELERGGVALRCARIDVEHEDLSSGVGVRISSILGEESQRGF
mgnify:CR=1 FL=1